MIPRKEGFIYVDSILFVPAFGHSGRAVKANQINLFRGRHFTASFAFAG